MAAASSRPPSSSSSLPSFFTTKKSQILSSLATSSSPSYTDKSPKGSIDADIVDLIDLINSFPGYVTTSSCAGRVAVFVEGRKIPDLKTTTKLGPGGKGAGNRWLYVSHERVPMKLELETRGGDSAEADVDVDGRTKTKKQCSFHDIFGLTPQSTTSESTATSAFKSGGTASTEADDDRYPTTSNVRLVKLSFSPLILHILCSSLQTAKPLLAAAINAGFRESGVQSLKALDDDEAGVMVAIRTAGLAFETAIGWVDERQQQPQELRQAETEANGEREIYRSCVSEGVLRMFVGVVNDRFGWNEQRRERLRAALLLIGEDRQNVNGHEEWEDKAARKERKKEEGLRRQKEEKEQQSKTTTEKDSKSNGQREEEMLENDTTALDAMDLFQKATP